MKIRTKLSLAIAVMLIATAALTVLVCIASIKARGRIEKEQYRREELGKVKSKLRNLVNLAYEVAETNYGDSRDREFLKKFYGHQLRNAIDIAYETIKINYNNAHDKSYIEKRYGDSLKSIIEIAMFILKDNEALVKEGKLGFAEAKRQAAESVRKIKYDETWNTGYLWINDNSEPYPKMIMHPVSPELEGKIMKDPRYKCAKGDEKDLFKAFVKICREKGEGFVEYKWPKPNGKKGFLRKLSYVKLFKPWNWIVGTGIYIEDAVREAKKTSLDDIRKMRFDDNKGYFWVNDSGFPYPTMIMHPVSPSLEGKMLDSKQYNCAFDKNKNLFQAAVEICRTKGEGFVFYKWPKPGPDGKLIPDVPKLSYVKLFKPWDWIIGTGIYIDDAEEEAKKMSIAEIRKMRYDGGAGYFWINDNTKPLPKMIMHPITPELENKPLDNPVYNCTEDGKNIFAAIVEACGDSSGFIKYHWDKPLPDGKSLPNAPKLSYMRFFKPWNWIIGTGIYIDGIDRQIEMKEKEIDAHIRSLITKIIFISAVILLVALFVTFFLADSLANPIRNLIKAMEEVKAKGLATVTVTLKGSFEIRKLGSIFNEMLIAIHEAVEKLKQTTAAKEKIESELNIARDIQLSIIPKLFPAFPDRPEFDVHAVLDTARAVGGDLYDFFFIDDDHLYFALGDVSGKGVPASLFMAVTQTLSRSKADKGVSAGELVTGMNRDLCRDNEMSMFVTYFACILDIRRGELEYCNAGHNPPYIIRKSGKVESLKTKHGIPLGVFPENDYSCDKIALENGDSIVLYTDGVTEAMSVNNEEYGEKRLSDILNANAQEKPRNLTGIILRDVKEFTCGAEQSDDITILILTYTGD